MYRAFETAHFGPLYYTMRQTSIVTYIHVPWMTHWRFSLEQSELFVAGEGRWIGSDPDGSHQTGSQTHLLSCPRDIPSPLNNREQAEQLLIVEVWDCTRARYSEGMPWAWGRGYIEARTDTTQQSGHTPDKEVDINHITVYVSRYTETNTIGMLSPNDGRLSGAKQSGFVSSRESRQTSPAVCIRFECYWYGQNVSNRTC